MLMLIQLATVIKWEKREHSNKCVCVYREQWSVTGLFGSFNHSLDGMILICDMIVVGFVVTIKRKHNNNNNRQIN